MSPRLLAAASAFALLAGQLPVVAHAQAPAAAGPSGWVHQASDLKPDPAIRFGVLPNGMKYALMRNATPAGEASLRLRIDAGSLAEREDQRGLAHFMEHMVFNGTRNVPEGEFVKRLERRGLAFGPDTNAYTSFEETVYMLELPETDAETVDTALLLMREAAGEALMAADAIDRERGVILSEERTRDTPGLRMIRAQYDFLMQGQLPPKRFPIGDTTVIRSAPRERFAAFYEAYYRPENATLVAVGDFDVDAMERKIRERFSDWRGQGPAGAPPELGAVAQRGTQSRAFVEAGAPSQLVVAWASAAELDPDTAAERREATVEALGLAVLNRRLERLARQDKPPFVAASARHGAQLEALDLTQLVASYRPGEWRQALEAIEQEQRRAVEHGVTQKELDREITEMRVSLQNAVAGQATRRSSTIASQIVGAVNEEEVVTAPEQDLAVFQQAVAGLKADQVNAVLRDLFRGSGPLVFVSSPQPITDADRAVAAAFERSRAVAVAPPSQAAAKAWAYTDFGAPGRVVERREARDLGTTFVRFANGVRLTVRPSTNRKDEVLAAVRVGDGELDLPRDKPTPALFAGTTLSEGGLGRMTTEEIEEALAADIYSVGFVVEDDAFVLSGRTRPEDLDTQMQVLAAYLTDAAWRPQGFERMRAFAPNLHNQLEANPSGVMQRDLPRLLRSGDKRFGIPTREEFAGQRLEDIRGAIGAAFATEPLEVVIAGDVTVEEAIARTAATFGALPARRGPATRLPRAEQAPFPRAPAAPVALSHKGRADQALGLVAWPTADFVSDPQRARVLRVLEQVIRLRLLDELREGQAVTYSPITGYQAAWVYPGYGYVSAAVEAPPEKLDGFFADVRKIAAALKAAPPTADELDRAIKPRMEALQRSQASNEYWLGELGGAQTDPRRLEAIRQAIPGLQKVTPAQVQAAARQYLADDKAWRMVIRPEPRAGGAAAAASGGGP
jgi:zinc protease